MCLESKNDTYRNNLLFYQILWPDARGVCRVSAAAAQICRTDRAMCARRPSGFPVLDRCWLRWYDVTERAGVAKQADARDLKSLGGSTVRVRAPPPAPLRNDLCISDDRLGRVHLDSKGLSSFKPAIADAGLQVCFFLKLPLAARILALRRGSMPDGAFLRFKIATVRADCDFVFGIL